jgi:hypothetical protein
MEAYRQTSHLKKLTEMNEKIIMETIKYHNYHFHQKSSIYNEKSLPSSTQLKKKKQQQRSGNEGKQENVLGQEILIQKFQNILIIYRLNGLLFSIPRIASDL